mmetsp:Transcript_112118/g.219807  ORF Transcript_112118/g.219807 Transcript_112118/m.219807 type:complete len:227 (+) Transcript_112118:674-1354(+)
MRTTDADWTALSKLAEPGVAPLFSAQALVVPKLTKQSATQPVQFKSQIDKNPLGNRRCSSSPTVVWSAVAACGAQPASGSGVLAGSLAPPGLAINCGASTNDIAKPTPANAASPSSWATHRSEINFPIPPATAQRRSLSSGGKISFMAARVGVSNRSWQESRMPKMIRNMATPAGPLRRGVRIGKRQRPAAPMPPRRSTKGLLPQRSVKCPSTGCRNTPMIGEQSQ